MNQEELKQRLIELLAKYFDIGDSYAYNLTRVKSAFACGTIGLDDFEEFDEETVADIAEVLIANGVTIRERGEWKDNTYCTRCGYSAEDYEGYTMMSFDDFCPHCGADMRGVKDV